MRHTEEFATDELRQEEPEITEKLILAMEGILQMSEAQAKSVSAITDAISEIRFALERQGSAINELRNAVNEIKVDQIQEPVLADIHGKMRNLSEAWNIVISSNSALEERLTKLEAKTDNINENISGLFERMEGDIRQLSMAFRESVDNNQELQERINAARVAAQRAAEGMEEIREISEINKQAIKSLRERAEANAAMIEASRKLVESIKGEIQNRMDQLSASINSKMEDNEDAIKKRIDYIFSSLNDKIDDALAFTNKKIDTIQEVWQTSQLVDFEEHEKMNLALAQVQLKLIDIEKLITELKSKPRKSPAKRRTPARKRAPRRRVARPTGAVVDYKAIEEMIENYTRENNRVTIDAVRGHTGIGETTLRKILHNMVREGRLLRQRQGKFVYYSVP